MADLSQRAKVVEDPVGAVVGPALKFGAACGTAGFLFGGTSGILKATTPFLFATASGIQTFALGTTFWACRSTLLRMKDISQLTGRDYTVSSAAAGGLSGAAVAIVTRGRRNVLPAACMWSLLGGVGQMTYNAFSSESNVSQQPKEGFWRRMADKSWSPVTVMSDEQYAAVLREKMLKVDVEIAILDERIAALKSEQGKGQTASSVEKGTKAGP